MCCWNVATYKWTVHNEKIEIISVVIKSFFQSETGNKKNVGSVACRTNIGTCFPKSRTESI
jgi:hypothetical protein